MGHKTAILYRIGNTECGRYQFKLIDKFFKFMPVFGWEVFCHELHIRVDECGTIFRIDVGFVPCAVVVACEWDSICPAELADAFLSPFDEPVGDFDVVEL